MIHLLPVIVDAKCKLNSEIGTKNGLLSTNFKCKTMGKLNTFEKQANVDSTDTALLLHETWKIIVSESQPCKVSLYTRLVRSVCDCHEHAQNSQISRVQQATA